MLMLPGKKGSEEKGKNAGEKRLKEYYLKKKNKIPVGSHPDIVTWEDFF